MRSKILISGAAAVAAVAALSGGTVAAEASGPPPFQCSTTINGGTIESDVQVPANAACFLDGVTVKGSVAADSGSYFESNGSRIWGSVVGNQALTLYIRNGSVVGRSVAGHKTAQVFVYNSAIGRSVSASDVVAPGFGHFQVCGSTIEKNVSAVRMGPDVLIGDPATGCGANTVKGNVVVASNTTNSELYVIGNQVPNGDIRVTDNAGSGGKVVSGNSAPHDTLTCSGNSAPFDGSNNVVAGNLRGGQCSAATVTGKDSDDKDGQEGDGHDGDGHDGDNQD